MNITENNIINAAVSNFGPQHPSTHGALRLISILHGEIALKRKIVYF